MSDWGYVAVAYVVVGAALLLYTVLLAQRVFEARHLTQSLTNREQPDNRPAAEDSTLCDAPPAL